MKELKQFADNLKKLIADFEDDSERANKLHTQAQEVELSFD